MQIKGEENEQKPHSRTQQNATKLVDLTEFLRFESQKSSTY